MRRCVDGVGVFLFAAFLAVFAVPARAQEHASSPPRPIATLTTGWTYLWADQGNHYRSNLNGWWLKPTVNLPDKFFVYFSSTNYYGTNAKGSVNSHGFTGGVGREVLSRRRFKLTVYGESGMVRASSAGTITNELLISAGCGVSIPLRRWVSLAVTPAQYVFLYPHQDWRNDYNAKLGLTFPFGHR
jgi:hypothetical protein